MPRRRGDALGPRDDAFVFATTCHDADALAMFDGEDGDLDSYNTGRLYWCMRRRVYNPHPRARKLPFR